jgi:hypothetical protein
MFVYRGTVLISDGDPKLVVYSDSDLDPTFLIECWIRIRLEYLKKDLDPVPDPTLNIHSFQNKDF